MAIASPPVQYPCYYGLDTSRRKELIAREKATEEIAEYIGADTLNYLSLEGILKVLEADDYGYCTACFNGQYPTEECNEKEVDKNGIIL
jgi:amidophosphoribosyltransferase